MYARASLVSNEGVAGFYPAASLFPAHQITDPFGAVTLAVDFIRFQMEHIADLIERVLAGDAQRQFALENQRLRFERMRVIVKRRAGFPLHEYGCLETLARQHFDEIVAFHDRSLSS